MQVKKMLQQRVNMKKSADLGEFKSWSNPSCKVGNIVKSILQTADRRVLATRSLVFYERSIPASGRCS
jgi:hypothetical protein